MGSQGLAKQSLPNGFVGALLLANFLLWISPAYGRTILETFDSGSYNTSLFEFTTSAPNQITSAVVDGQLQITISETISPPFTGYLETLKALIPFGCDFDVQVDFNLGPWPAKSNVAAAIVTNVIEIRRVSSQNAPYEYYECQIPGWGFATTPQPITDTSGKLRVKRTGLTVQAFYWQNGAWQSPSGFSALGTPNWSPVYIGLKNEYSSVSSPFRYPPLTAAFDNLKIILPGSTAWLPLLLE